MSEGRGGRRRTPRLEAVEPRLLPSAALPARVAVYPVAYSTPLTPITELTAGYRGEDGGLYGSGSNTPPASQATALDSASARVVPRNAAGLPSASGKIGFVAIGQSTTRLEFGAFQLLLAQDPGRNPAVVAVNAGQDNRVLQNWAGTTSPWASMLRSVRAAGLSPAQVQVVWIDLAQIFARQFGVFSARTNHYAALMTRVVETAKRYFPNLQVAYLSSRIYGGYGPRGVDPEPYAYESGFGVRQTIQSQVAGAPTLNDDPALGRVVAPVLAWGPYQWADGTTPRADGFSWKRADFVADGVHPSFSGQLKGAGLLRTFLQSDPSARRWFGD